MAIDKRTYKSNSPWEEKVGYSRAVRIGDLIEVSGTTAVNDEDEIVGDNAYEQSMFIFQKIEKTLDSLGASMDNVIRTRMYVVNIERDWEGVGKAHHHFLQHITPAATMVEVSRLIDSKLLVEIEVTAWMD